MTLLGLTGYARSGKDTAAGVLGMWGGWQRIAFADKLKTAAYETNPTVLSPDHETWTLQQIVDMGGWEEAKGWPSVREYLQRLGVAMRTSVHPEVWVRAALSEADPYADTVVTDVRFPNEADAILAQGGVVIRVNRPGVGPVNAHASETALDDRTFPTVENTGTPERLANDICYVLNREPVAQVRTATR